MTGQGDFTDYSYSERRGFLRMHSKQGSDHFGYYQMGEFLHPNGIVTIYQQDDFTRMDFMHGDRLHTRQWDRQWGNRSIPRLARQFVTDISASILK